MLSEVRNYFGITREISSIGQFAYFETTQLQQLVAEIKLVIRESTLIVLAGIVGTGKTTMLEKIQDLLEQGKDILVASSLSVDGSRVTEASLIWALLRDLSNEKNDSIPRQTEQREGALCLLIRKRKKPVALFIDDAHQLPIKTLLSLKRLMEIVRRSKGRLSVVLAGHPKLKNNLFRASVEEIGGRIIRFELSGFGKDKKAYLHWLLEQVTAPKIKPDALLTDAAAALLCERLTTPLQFEFYLTRVFEEAFHVGQKPADADTVASVLAPDLDGMEARLARNGYDLKALTEMIAAKPKDIRLFLSGRLPPERTQELHDQLLAAGVPL